MILSSYVSGIIKSLGQVNMLNISFNMIMSLDICPFQMQRTSTREFYIN